VRVSPARQRPRSGAHPTPRWRRLCAARARDPRRSRRVRRRDRRIPGSVSALIGQSAARQHGGVAGEPDQASGARFGAGSTRGTGSHEIGDGVGGSQPSGDGQSRPMVTRGTTVTLPQAMHGIGLIGIGKHETHCSRDIVEDLPGGALRSGAADHLGLFRSFAAPSGIGRPAWPCLSW